MSSGVKQVVVNTLERAVSTDINRLQAFSNFALAELMRYWVDVSVGNDDTDAAGLLVSYTTLEAPLRGEIISGLGVKPVLGALDLLIDPGAMFVLQPDSAPDDSNYKYILDPGILSTGVLAMGPNSSGQTRIDVIEVSPAAEIVEVDNRDIFNPATNLFSPTSVTKATQMFATYAVGTTVRVRQGTSGGGFPGVATGWMPLCVASVPTATTTNDTITFWDVRPMLVDRVRPPYNVGQNKPYHRKSFWNAASPAAAAGVVEVEVNGRRLGGQIATTSPLTGAAANSIDFTNAANRDASTFTTANTPWFVYCLTAFGLPRWARYTDSTFGVRRPRSPRGLIVASTTPPKTDGTPSSAIAVPVATGLLTSVSTGVCVGAGVTDSGSGFRGFLGSNDDGYRIQNQTAQGFDAADPIKVSATSVTYDASNNVIVQFDLTTPLVPSARAIDLDFHIGVVLTNGATSALPEGNVQMFVMQPNTPASQAYYEGLGTFMFPSGATGTVRIEKSVKIPLQGIYPTVAAGYTLRIFVYLNDVGSGMTLGATNCFLVQTGYAL